MPEGVEVILGTPPPMEVDGPVLEENIARRVLASYDRLGDLAESLEGVVIRGGINANTAIKLVLASGTLREKQIYAGSELLGDVKAAMKTKRAVKEA